MSKQNQGSGADRSPAGMASRGWFTRFLDTVEWLGNLLPHPVTLFAALCVIMIGISGITGYFGLSVTDPRPGVDGAIEVRSLLNGDGLRWLVANLVENFVGFAPLGVVLVALLGVGVADKSGLLSAVIRSIVVKVPSFLIVPALVFCGILSNTASEMGYVVLVPLAGIIFLGLGRHPLAGMAAAFAGVSGGYSANLLLGTLDPLLAGITQEAAQLVDPEYRMDASANYFFMVASTFVITAVGTFVTSYIVEPKLGRYNPGDASEDLEDEHTLDPVTDNERRGMRWAGVAALIMLGLFALSVIPEWGVLRNQATGSIKNSPFLDGIVALIFVFFFVPGIVYGAVTGVIRNDRDVVDAMAASMSTLGLYIVLVFFASQFVAIFGETNLGRILAVMGANGLQAIGLTGPLVFLFFILMSGTVNLSLGSASAQWAVTAPIFVPMLMLIGYSPEVIQAAYRIGDSVTNIITPMMSYFGLIMAFMVKYDRKTGIGTIIAMMLPYSMFFIVAWMALFFLWVFGLGLPVGPEAPTFYDMGAASG
jgi:aminobenzoyl-glutamate transport protein